MTNPVSTVHGVNAEFDDPVEVTCAELATLALSLHPVHGETRDHAIVRNVEFSTFGQKWIEDKTIVKRLYNIVTSSDVNSGRYNIYNSLPLNTHWRSPGLADWRQRLMAGKLPVTFWVCGEVNRLGARFATASGDQLPIVSINLTPSRIGESVQWLSYLDSFGGRQPEIRALNNVCARKHMALPSGYSDMIAPFHQSYDATHTLDLTNPMPLWPITDIRRGDLVMMEVGVVRSQTDDKGISVYDGKWASYVVELELLAVCMICKGNLKTAE